MIMFAENLLKPIPRGVGLVKGWETNQIIESGEPLATLGPFSDFSDIFTSSIYAGERFDSPYSEKPFNGSVLTLFVREEVAKRLRQAQQLLPSNYYLIVFDGWRSLDVQQALFNSFYRELQQLGLSLDEHQLLGETQKYVSLPSTDPSKPSPHNTGGAVDLAIFKLPKGIGLRVKQINQQLATETDWRIVYELEMEKIFLQNEHGRLLEFGTPFDFGKQQAALRWFEDLKNLRSRKNLAALFNRRLLYTVMRSTGFQPLESEWWHYNFGNQMAVQAAGEGYAIYGVVELSPKNISHENMRRGHRKGTILMHQGVTISPKLAPPSEEFMVALKAAQTGDYRSTNLPLADKISPLSI